MATSLEQAFAEIDRQMASFAAKTASTSKEEALVAFIASHRSMARKVIADAKAKRRWLKNASGSNPGVGRFYGEHLDLVFKAIARHRKNIARARADLRALAVIQMKEAA